MPTRIRVYYNVRDRFGHFVTPPTAANRACPHACCRNKHPHPSHLPVRLDKQVLRGMGSDELERELEHYAHFYDTHGEGGLQVAAEIDRRASIAKNAAARKERAKDRRRHAEEEYRDEVYRQWLRAEAETNGYMLNKEGRAKGIDERSLFTGPEVRVKKYATRELIEFFEANPRPTRASWFGSATSRRAHLAGRRIGLCPTSTIATAAPMSCGSASMSSSTRSTWLSCAGSACPPPAAWPTRTGPPSAPASRPAAATTARPPSPPAPRHDDGPAARRGSGGAKPRGSRAIGCGTGKPLPRTASI